MRSFFGDFPILLSACWSLSKSSASVVPGCDCPASSICTGDDATDTAPCHGVLGLANVLGVSDSTDMPVCDAIFANESFQSEYGSQATTFSVGRTGPWAPSAQVPVLLGQGSCQDAIMKNSICSSNTATVRSVETNSVFSHRSFLVEPTSCDQWWTSLPGSQNTAFAAISYRCRGYFDILEGDTVYGMDLLLELSGSQPNIDLCDASSQSLQPFLSAEDWVEAEPGRRYMCKEFMSDGTTFFALVLSLGNEPCSDRVTTIGDGDSSSGGGRVTDAPPSATRDNDDNSASFRLETFPVLQVTGILSLVILSSRLVL